MNNYNQLTSILVIVLLYAILGVSGQDSGMKLVEITNPRNGDNVSWQFAVEGNSSATTGSGLKVYVLIWPIEANGPWWVQPTQTFSDGSWESYAYFGRDSKLYPDDIGTSYRVVAVIINEELREGQVFPELPINSRSNRSEVIIVTRIK